MLYEAHYFGTAGEITIQVFDGEGGSCLTEEEHSIMAVHESPSLSSPFSTIYRGQCYESAVVIQVEALEGDLVRDDGVWNWPDWLRVIAIVIALCLAVSCAVSACKCCECASNCVSAGLQKEVDVAAAGTESTAGEVQVDEELGNIGQEQECESEHEYSA
jgi:hypothetical protein